MTRVRSYRDQRSPALEDAARGTSRRLLRTKRMGGMASTPQNTSKIDFLRMSLPCACRLHGAVHFKWDRRRYNDIHYLAYLGNTTLGGHALHLLYTL